MNKTVKNILQFIIFGGFGFGILYYFFQTQQADYAAQCQLDGVPAADCSLMKKLVNDFKSVKPFWMVLVLIAFTFSNVSRAIRWKMLMNGLEGHRPKLSNAFYAVMISYTTNLWMSRMGEVVRGGSIKKYEKISLPKVMGTIIIDRLLDMITLGIIVGFAFLLQFDTLWNYLRANLPRKSNDSLLTNPYFIIGGVVLLAFLYWAYQNRVRFENSKFYHKTKESILNLLEGLKTVKKVEHPKWFIFHSLNIWLMYFFMTYLCFSAFAPTAHLGPLAALIVFVFGTFGMVIPSPGGMGTYHFMCISALTIYGINKIDAFSFANIMFFSINIFYNIGMGIFSFLMLHFGNRNYVPFIDKKLESKQQYVAN